MQQGDRVTGAIKFFNSERGFGFIQTADARDFFAHISQVQGDFEPIKHDRVEFTPDKGRDGRPYARRIVILKGDGE